MVEKIYGGAEKDTGGGDQTEVKPPLTEDIIKETMDANPGTQRQDVIDFLEGVGYDASEFKEA